MRLPISWTMTFARPLLGTFGSSGKNWYRPRKDSVYRETAGIESQEEASARSQKEKDADCPGTQGGFVGNGGSSFHPPRGRVRQG
jgi:hypothetical protein